MSSKSVIMVMKKLPEGLSTPTPLPITSEEKSLVQSWADSHGLRQLDDVASHMISFVGEPAQISAFKSNFPDDPKEGELCAIENRRLVRAPDLGSPDARTGLLTPPNNGQDRSFH